MFDTSECPSGTTLTYGAYPCDCPPGAPAGQLSECFGCSGEANPRCCYCMCIDGGGHYYLNGNCGSASGHIFAATDTSFSPYTQCASGMLQYDWSDPPNTCDTFPCPGEFKSWTCKGTPAGAIDAHCSAGRLPACGGANGHTFAYGDTGYDSNEWLWGVPPHNQCNGGSPDNLAFPTPGQTVYWSCMGATGTSYPPICSATRSSTPDYGTCGSAASKWPAGSNSFGTATFCSSGTATPTAPIFPYAGNYPAIGTYTVGTHPYRVAIDPSGNVWVTNYGSGTVTKLDPSGNILNTYTVGNGPYGIIYASGYIWVTNNTGNTISKINTSTGTVNTYPAGTNPYLLVYASGTIWVTNWGGSSVTKFDTNGNVLGTYYAGNTPTGITVDASGNIWVINAGQVFRKFDQNGNEMQINSNSVGGYPSAITADAFGNIWIANGAASGGYRVTKLDSSTGNLLGNYRVGSYPWAITADSLGNIWVVNNSGNTITKLDPSGNTEGVYLVPNTPYGIAADASGNIWVTSYNGNNVTKIGAPGTGCGSTTWICLGANGQADTTCTATLNCPPINGVCGGADGHIFAYNDTSYSPYTQCSTGTSSNTAFPGVGSSVFWTCTGSNGGTSASCSASRAKNTKTNGTCGSAVGDYGKNEAWPHGSYCASGNYSPAPPSALGSSNGSTSAWTCQGTNGGTNASCSATRKSTDEVIDGVCGGANGRIFAYTDTSYSPYTQCSAGTSSNISFPDPGDSAIWQCVGSGTGHKNATCSATRNSQLIGCNSSHQCVIGGTLGPCTVGNQAIDCNSPPPQCNSSHQCVIGGTLGPCTVGNQAIDCNSPPPQCNSSHQCVIGGTLGPCTVGNQAIDCNSIPGVCGWATTPPTIYPYTGSSTTISTNLCLLGTPPTAKILPAAFGSTITWTCAGQNGGSNSGTCTATRTGPPINGACGTAAKNYPAGSAGFGNDTFCSTGTPFPSNPIFPLNPDSETYSIIGIYSAGVYPYDVAIDNSGNVWVADYYFGTVTKLGPAGNKLGTYIVGGLPFGIAVDKASGNVWVTNHGGGNVTKLDSSGNILAAPAVGWMPQGIAIDSSGNVWVADYSSGTVTKLSSNGSTLGTYTVGGQPHYIAIDSSGNVWVTNTAFIFDNGHVSKRSITKIKPSDGSKTTYYFIEGKHPYGIAADASGNVWVTDYAWGNIIKLDLDGNIIGTYSAGTGIWPTDITIDASGNVWVSNYVAGSVTKLDSLGAIIGTYSAGSWPLGIAVDASGNVWVANDWSPGFFSANESTVTKLGRCINLITTTWVCNGINGGTSSSTCTATVPCPTCTDSGLRVYNGTKKTVIAGETPGTVTSPLRIKKNGGIWGIPLVNPGDPLDSGARIKINSGIKALKKCP